MNVYRHDYDHADLNGAALLASEKWAAYGERGVLLTFQGPRGPIHRFRELSPAEQKALADGQW